MAFFIRRILWIAAGVAVILLLAVLGVARLSRETIGFGEKCGGGNCWSFQLDQYRASKRTVLTISGTWGLHLEYEFPRMHIERVSEDRWLATDRAVHLNLRLKPFSDPSSAGDPVQLVFDFQRGEMYVTSPLPLWRVRDYRSGNPARNWMTEAEFQRVLTGIEP